MHCLWRKMTLFTNQAARCNLEKVNKYLFCTHLDKANKIDKTAYREWVCPWLMDAEKASDNSDHCFQLELYSNYERIAIGKRYIISQYLFSFIGTDKFFSWDKILLSGTTADCSSKVLLPQYAQNRSQHLTETLRTISEGIKKQNIANAHEPEIINNVVPNERRIFKNFHRHICSTDVVLPNDLHCSKMWSAYAFMCRIKAMCYVTVL